MKRILCTSRKYRCQFGCIYCFASFSQYSSKSMLDIEEISAALIEKGVIYPACDFDLFAVYDYMSLIEPLTYFPLSISISTKAALHSSTVRDIRHISARLGEDGRILKIGLSLSSKTKLTAVEPGAASYAERLETARALKKASIPAALILKPILSDVPVDEYKLIIDDFSTYVNAVLLGNEYLDENKHNYEAAQFISRKRVHWLSGGPLWPYRNLSHVIHSLERHCRKLELPCFDSDRDLMAHLIHRYSARSRTAKHHRTGT